MDRRTFLIRSLAAGLAAGTLRGHDSTDLKPVLAEVEKRRDEALTRLQEWVRLASIAAENRGMDEGCSHMMRLARDAGFDQVTRIPTDGHPSVFGTLDAGAPRTVGLYFMYDVKQVDPAEWSSPPWEARLVDRPGIGKVLMGRGAVNQKGPQSATLAALHAFKAAGRKPPVNLVLVAEGEEEIGSPHFPQVIRRPEVTAALKKCVGVYMPSASQSLDGTVAVSLGAKGVIEVELVSSGQRWGRGPKHDIHSSNAARVDSPAWRLVKALNTLVEADGHTPAVEGLTTRARPISAQEKEMIREAARRMSEATARKMLGVDKWIEDAGWQEALERLVSRPTVNIEGLVGGYTGPGGKTILPHKATAKLDLRLVPDMKASEALAALKAHLAKRGFPDIEVNMTGGYDPTSTEAGSSLIRAQIEVLRAAGIDLILWPRNAGSWPGYVFTGDPLRLPAGHFGMGHGSGAHGPDEYYLIESSIPKVEGYAGAIASHVQYLQQLARQS